MDLNGTERDYKKKTNIHYKLNKTSQTIFSRACCRVKEWRTIGRFTNRRRPRQQWKEIDKNWTWTVRDRQKWQRTEQDRAGENITNVGKHSGNRLIRKWLTRDIGCYERSARNISDNLKIVFLRILIVMKAADKVEAENDSEKLRTIGR